MNSKKLFIFLFLITFSLACQADALDKVSMTLGKREFMLEVAHTDAQREKGLMFRKFMKKNHGMIFIFNEDDIRGFWMENTYLPLSIAYVSMQGEVLEIHPLTPHDRSPVASLRPFRFAIEVNQGEFEKAGLAVGDFVDLSVLAGKYTVS